jgi:tetratricopeptide (TPR) repeat protein
MHGQYPTLLAQLIAQSDQTQDEIVEGYVRCARQHKEDAALSLRTLRRWMAGHVTTQPRPAQRRVAHLYWGHSMNALLAPPMTSLLMPAISSSDLIPSASRDGGGLTNLERQITMSARRSARFTTYAETSNTGAEAIEQLRHDVVGVANSYLRQPLTAIMGDLIELQDVVFTLLEGKQKPVQTRDLYLLAGVATGMVAKASQDLGRFHEAITLARTTSVCADNADHHGMRAWARNLQALIAFWAGRPQESVRFAQAGSELGAPVTGSVMAWLASSEARAWAQLGDADQARASLARAADHRDRHAPDDLDHIGGLCAFPLAKQHYYAADAHIFLTGAETDADREATQALALYEAAPDDDRAFGDEAGARSDLALARLRAGALDGTRDALAPVFDLPPDKRIGGIITSVNRVHNALRDPAISTSALARDLRDEIEAFGRTPAAAITA